MKSVYDRKYISRKMEIDTLYEIISNYDYYKENSVNGLSILLNGIWGSGKTKFIEEFRSSSTEEYNILDIYNSFEYDFYENPFIPFFSFLEKQLNVGIDVNRLASITGTHAIKNAFAVSMAVLKQVIEKATGIDTDKIQEELKKIANEYNDDYDVFNAFNELEIIKKDVKTKIKKMAEEKPIILIIDELDRCNPRFAIGTLEIIKHFLDIENLIIIFSLDKSQLQESVKTIYGQQMDSDIYFSKFFDYQFNLSRIEFKKIVNFEEDKDLEQILKALNHLADDLNISIRDTNKILNEFIMKYNSYNLNEKNWTVSQSIFIVFMLLLKNIDLLFFNSIINMNYSNYKEILKSSGQIMKKKYLKILEHRINDSNISIENCIQNLQMYRNENYASLEKLYHEPIFAEDRRTKLILEKMSFFIPQVVEGKTYLENLLMILNN